MNAHTPMPDPVAIRAHLKMLHDLAAQAKVDGYLVLVGLGENPRTGAALNVRATPFAIGDVDRMTDAALSLCQEPNRNVYCSWAVMRKDLGRNQRGGDDDIVAVLAISADQDADIGKVGVAELPLEAPYTVASSSANRQPVYPLARPLSTREAAPIAAAISDFIGGDSSKDPSHVWRIPGTLNWPNKAKIDRGRPFEPQLVAVASEWWGEVIDPDELAAAFKARKAAPEAPDFDPDLGGLGPKAEDVFKLAAALADIPNNDLSRDDWNKVGMALWAATEGSEVGRALFIEWSLRSAKCTSNGKTASLRWDHLKKSPPTKIGAGTIFHMAREARQRREQTDAEPDFDAKPKEKPKTAKSGGFRGIDTSGDFMAGMRPPEYLIDGLIEVGFAYSLTARTGHGKTLLGMLMAFGVAHSGLFGWRDVRRGSVLFLAGENPDNVRRQWYGVCSHHGVDPATLPVYWHEGSFDLDAGMDALIEAANGVPDLRIVVADTLASFFTGDNFNDNNQMLETAKTLRSISEKVKSRPTGVCLAHPVKNAAKDNLLPFGGGTIVNEFDGNLTLWSPDGETTTLHWQGKHRGAPFDPIDFKLHRFEPPGLVDARGRPMPMTIALPLTEAEAEVKAKEAESTEDRALAAIKRNPRISQRDLAAATGIPRTSAQRLMKKLAEDRWIKKHARGWVLTPAGEAVLDG